MKTKITQPTLVRVHGWVMLAKVDDGKYRIELGQPDRFGFPTYKFYRPKGRKPITRHLADSVDSKIRDKDSGGLNYIEILDAPKKGGTGAVVVQIVR